MYSTANYNQLDQLFLPQADNGFFVIASLLCGLDGAIIVRLILQQRLITSYIDSCHLSLIPVTTTITSQKGDE